MKSKVNGFLNGNAVLEKGMVIAPIVICCTTLHNALLVSVAFALITFVTVCICQFYSKNLNYAMRIVCYALTGAAMTIPVLSLCRALQPDYYDTAGDMTAIYLPLLSVNSFIVLYAESYFYQLPRKIMPISLFFHILGFCGVACLVGIIREILSFGTILGNAVDMPLLMRGFSAPWGGFILLGILCALHRVIFSKKG
ncbi:MAG: Rnf-Nqr domain containing protein [Oscillospiraceae bacterium]